jgi:hypothetical protein
MTSGWFWMWAGVPSAIFLPKFSATMWSDTAITRLMWCSTSSTVMPQPVADVADQIRSVHQFFVVQAGGRLVEQQQLGLGGQRAAQFDPLLDGEGQVAGGGRLRYG